MKILMRTLWLLVLLGCTALLLAGVPGYRTEGDSSIHLGILLRQVIDPLPLVVCLFAALVAGRWSGLKTATRYALGAECVDGASAGKTLAAAARGLLYGTLLVNGVYLVSFYWPESPLISAGFMGEYRYCTYVQYGPLVVGFLGAFLLMPCAVRARSATADTKHSLLRPLDPLAWIGLFACPLVVLLSVFVYRYPAIGVEGSGVNYVLPAAGLLDSAFVAWSLLVVALLPWVVLCPHASPRELFRALRNPTSAGPDLVALLTQTQLVAGLYVATLIQLVGLNYISNTGGSGNPAEIQDLVGRMLVPVSGGGLFALVFGLMNRVRVGATRSRMPPGG